MATIQKRPTREGKIAYRALVRLKGYRAESATFERLTDARDWVQQTEAAMKERRHFKGAESKKHTLSELIDRYLAQLERENPRRHKEVQPLLKWWKDELGHSILAALTKNSIAEKIEKLASYKRELKSGGVKPRSPARVNRFITALSRVCTVAIDKLGWLEHHPLQKRLLKEPRGRVRFLDDDERGRLLIACKASENSCLYPIVVLALSTGARLTEITTLKWKNVDLNRKVITLHKTKNGEIRPLPLTGHALELMEERGKIRHSSSDLVFPSPNDLSKPYYIRTAWCTAVKNAEIEDFRFHDLRHSAASYMAMNSASSSELAAVLGHKSLAMVKRYAHLSESHTRSVVASMNEKIFAKRQEEKNV